jgi:hypothetical protein
MGSEDTVTSVIEKIVLYIYRNHRGDYAGNRFLWIQQAEKGNGVNLCAYVVRYAKGKLCLIAKAW